MLNKGKIKEFLT